MADRSSDSERAAREVAALQLLSTGSGSAYAAALLAERYGVSTAAGTDVACDAGGIEAQRVSVANDR